MVFFFASLFSLLARPLFFFFRWVSKKNITKLREKKHKLALLSLSVSNHCVCGKSLCVSPCVTVCHCVSFSLGYTKNTIHVTSGNNMYERDFGHYIGLFSTQFSQGSTLKKTLRDYINPHRGIKCPLPPP